MNTETRIQKFRRRIKKTNKETKQITQMDKKIFWFRKNASKKVVLVFPSRNSCSVFSNGLIQIYLYFANKIRIGSIQIRTQKPILPSFFLAKAYLDKNNLTSTYL